jgi:hypothetical protein
MAAKRRASRRTARKEKSGERTTVELIRVKKYVKANTGFRRKAFPVRVRGSSESHIRTRRAKAASVPGSAIVVSNARMVGHPEVRLTSGAMATTGHRCFRTAG